MDTIESNKLIAEFMEIELAAYDMVWLSEKLHMDLIKGRDYLEWAETKNVDNITYVCVDIDYDWNWNWLMTVVKKIYSLGLDNENALLVRDAVAEANRKDAYQAVVEFIKTYNKEE
jgi:hypothetical protein